jgi:hypothetical protein
MISTCVPVRREKSDTLKFLAPETPGSYDFRLHDSDAGGTEIGFATFQVSAGSWKEHSTPRKSFTGRGHRSEFTAPEAFPQSMDLTNFERATERRSKRTA